MAGMPVLQSPTCQSLLSGAMAYNLRPRRASIPLPGAARPVICRFGGGKARVKCVSPQEGKRTRRRDNDCSVLKTKFFRRENHRAAAPLASSNEDESQRKQGTSSFPIAAATSPAGTAVEVVTGECKYYERTPNKQTRHNGSTQRKTSGLTIPLSGNCALRSAVITSGNSITSTAHFNTRCSPPARDHDATPPLRSMRKTLSSSGIPRVSHCVPTTSGSHRFLLPLNVEGRPKSSPMRKTVGPGHLDFLHASFSPRRACLSATDETPPQFRNSEIALHTPARSQNSNRICSEDLGQAGCSSESREHPATTVRHTGEAEATQLLMLLTSSTVMTPSASRGRKRRREFAKSEGVFYKKKGLSPQSFSIRTRTTASTVPSPSDLSSPPSTLPLASPATERQRDGTAVSLSAGGLTSKRQLYNPKPHRVAPPMPIEGSTELPPSANGSKSGPDDTLNPVPPSTNTNQSLVRSGLEPTPAQRVASAEYRAARTAVDSVRLRAYVPEHSNASEPGASCAAAPRARPVEQNGRAHRVSTLSPSSSGRTVVIADRHPIRMRCQERRRGSQPLVCPQQGEYMPTLSFLCSLSQTQVDEAHRTLRAVRPPGSRGTSSPLRAASDEAANEATEPSSFLLAGGTSTRLSSDARCLPSHAGGNNFTTTRGSPLRSYVGSHCSATLKVCNSKPERFSDKDNTLRDVSSTAMRLLQTSNSKQFCSSFADDVECHTLQAVRGVHLGTGQLAAAPCFHESARHCSGLIRQSTPTCQRPSGATNLPCFSHASRKSLLLCSLPPMILCRILRFLPLSSLAAFGATCTYTQRLLRLPATWKSLDEKSVGSWVRHHGKLTPHLPPCLDFEHEPGDAAQSEAKALHTTRQQVSPDIAAAAEPFTCVSRISVDLTSVRGLDQVRSVSQALLNLPAAALPRFTPVQIGRTGITRVVTSSGRDALQGTVPPAPAPAASAVRNAPTRPSDPHAASPAVENTAFNQNFSQSDETAGPAGSMSSRLNRLVAVQPLQPLSEEHSITRPPHTGSRQVDIHGNATLTWQNSHITPMQRLAPEVFETQADVQAQQQAADGNPACPRGGDGSGLSIQQQRERLRRTLTLLLSSHLCASHLPTSNLPLAPNGLQPQTLYASRELAGFPSRIAAESGIRRVYGSQFGRGGASSRGAPATPPGVGNCERRGLRSHASLEEDSSPARGIRQRRSSVEATGTQPPKLLQCLSTQVAAPARLFQGWSGERQNLFRQTRNRGAPAVQQQEFFHYRRPLSGLLFGVSHPPAAGGRPAVNDQPTAEHPRPELRTTGQIVSVPEDERSSAIERTEEIRRMREQVHCPQPVSRRDRQHLFFLHHLILRLQRPQQVSQGHHLPETAALRPRLLSTPPSTTELPSTAEEGPNANEEGCAQQGQHSGLADEQLSPAHRPQSGLDMRDRELRIPQTLQGSGASGRQGDRTHTRIGPLELNNQSVQPGYRPLIYLRPVGAATERDASHIRTSHSQSLRSIPHVLLSTQTDQLCATGRERHRFDHFQAGGRRSACTSLQQTSITTFQTRSGTQEGNPASGRPSSNCDHVSEEIAHQTYSTHAGGATENASHRFRRHFAANDGDSNDTQRLRSVRRLLIHMQQLVQVNFRLEARDLSHLQRLRAEVLTVANLLRQNAATLRLVKISVDLFALEGAAEVPPGFSASPYFTQLCVRSLHRFLHACFTADPEPTPITPKGSNLRGSGRSGSTCEPKKEQPFPHSKYRNVSVIQRGISFERSNADQVIFTVGGNQHLVHVSNENDTIDELSCTTHAKRHRVGRIDTCASHEHGHQQPAQDMSTLTQFSCSSARSRPRGVTQGDYVDGRKEGNAVSSSLSQPLSCSRLSLPNSFTSAPKGKSATEQQGQDHGGVQVDSEENATHEELPASPSGLRHRHVLRLDELGLSPCHTLSPHSDVALSLQSSPSGETRTDLLRQLREAFTESTAKDTLEQGAEADCDGKLEITRGAIKSSPCNLPNADSSIVYTENSNDAYCSNSEKAPAVFHYDSVGDCSRACRENVRHKTPRKTPLAHLQRLLHIGRETLQQVDLQGDPPRTFCCLHSRLKFSKLRRLSLGWTCTAELVLLHNMLLNGHLPQLRKLQFSGPSGGSGLSMMHLQLYALLNSPPSACPHHPPFPLPEIVSLASLTPLEVPISILQPSSLVVPGASADFTCCERFCEAYGHRKPFRESEEGGELSKAARTAKATAVAAFLRDDEMKEEGVQCVSHTSDPEPRQHKRAKVQPRATEAFSDHSVAANVEHIAQTGVLPNKPASKGLTASNAGENDDQAPGSDSAAVFCDMRGRRDACHHNNSNQSSASATKTAPQLLNQYKRRAQDEAHSWQLLACPLASAKEAFSFKCERCASMRGGTAHGVYFKYAALDIDFAALLDFRLALQRHGLFAFYKDERNKLNLLHVEGLTDVSGREAAEEEKSLENRLERKNEWKRRFAYLHIRSPPFSFSSSNHSGSRREAPHAGTDALSEGLSNAALWSVAPLPSRRAPFGKDQSTVTGGTVTSESRSAQSECPGPTVPTHTEHLEMETSHGSTKCSVTPSSSERSATRVDCSSGRAGSICSSSNTRLEVVGPGYLATHSGRVETAIAAGTAEEETPTATPTSREVRTSSNPSLSLAEKSPASSLPTGQNSQETNGDIVATPVSSGKTGAGGRTGHRLRIQRAHFFPRDGSPQNRERRGAELHSKQNPRVSGYPSPGRDRWENPCPSMCTGAQLGNCVCVSQETVQRETALQLRDSQEDTNYIRSGFTHSSSDRVPRSRRAAARHRGNPSELRVLRRVCEDGNHRSRDGNDPSFNCFNCAGEITALFDPTVGRAELSEQPASGTCRRTPTTQESVEPRTSNEAAAPCSERAAGPSASQPCTTEENSVSGLRISHEGQSHTEPRDQHRPPLQTGAELPNNAPPRHEGDEDNDQQATAGREAGALPKPDRSRTLCFPKVCPFMSGRDLFSLEMWLAPELCRDLHSAPNLSQLSKQLTYLWEHRLTAQQRAVYNDVIVKRYVQERQGVQEWNFDTAKAWWLGS